MRDIFLSVDNANDIIQIPIPPNEIKLNYGKNNTIFTSLESESGFYGNEKAQSLSFSSFFPSKVYPFSKTNNLIGNEYIDKLKDWGNKDKIIRIIITNSNINDDFILDDIDYGPKDGTNDIYYDLSFTKHNKANLKIKKVKNNIEYASTNTNSNNRYITANKVNFREGASTNHKIIGKFYKGDKVTFISSTKDWSYISYNNKKGYVHNDYISTVNTSKQYIEADKYPTIKRSSKGEYVKEAQKKLNYKGNYNLSIDGSFGSKTDSAVRNFQKKNKLSVDGSIGPKTWKVLNS